MSDQVSKHKHEHRERQEEKFGRRLINLITRLEEIHNSCYHQPSPA
uniref:Uncharacterized protein n=1 Tax=Salix viminalis TaxID=40686 RepID=A0A6N2N235_SALVM